MNLKRMIVRREKLDPLMTCCDLQITSEKTNEEYTGDDVIPSHSTVTTRRNPFNGQKFRNKSYVNDWLEPSTGSSKGTDGSALSLKQLLKTENLAEANAAEENKIKAVMFQSSLCYYSLLDAMKLVGLLPPNCFTCDMHEHHMQNWPKNRVAASADTSAVLCAQRRSVSLMHSQDLRFSACERTWRGTRDDASRGEAYGIKKENPPFLSQHVSSSSSEDEGPVPDALMCLICKDLMRDATITPCCRNSFCDKCIRAGLLVSDDHVCPVCKQSHVPPDALTANVFIEQEVNRFKKRSKCSRFSHSQKRPYSHSAGSFRSPSCSHRSRSPISEPCGSRTQPLPKGRQGVSGNVSEACRSRSPLYRSRCVSRRLQPAPQIERE